MPHISEILKENILHTTQQCMPGDVLLMQKESASKVYLCETGWLKVTIYTNEGNESVVGFCGPKAFHGLSNLFVTTSTFFTVIAHTKVDLIVFSKSDVEKFLIENPQHMVDLIKILGRVVSNSKVIGLAASYHEAIDKIYNLLLHVARVYGTEDEFGWKVPFPLTQQQISEIVGLSRVRTRECISTLEEQGRLQIIKREYKVLKNIANEK